MTTSTTTNTTTNDFTNNAEFWLAYDAAFEVFKEAGFTDNSDDVAVDALAAAGAAAKAYATWEDVADTVDAAWTAAALSAKCRVNPKTAAKEYQAAVAAEKVAADDRAAAVNALYAVSGMFDDPETYLAFRLAAAAANRASKKTRAAKAAVDAMKRTIETITLETAEGRTFKTSLVGLEIFGWNFDAQYIAYFKTLHGPSSFPCGQGMADAAANFEFSSVLIRCEGGHFLYSIDRGPYLTSGDDDQVLKDLNLLARLGDLREIN
jgi:hypothetical protein